MTHRSLFTALALLPACGGHDAPPPQQALSSPREDTTAEIAKVQATLDAYDGGPSSPNITPAMRAGLGHGLPPDAIRQLVMAHQGSLRRCYDGELARVPDLKGGVTMTWLIAPDGSVSSASVAASTIQNTNVEACVLAEVKAWTFPTSDAPTHVAAYPLKFGMH